MDLSFVVSLGKVMVGVNSRWGKIGWGIIGLGIVGGTPESNLTH